MSKIVIATTTFYSSIDDHRAILATRTVKEAVTSGFSIVVVDGSPSSTVMDSAVRDISQEEGVVILKQRNAGMGVSRRQAIEKAVEIAGKDVIVMWMEPEKWPLIKYISEITKPIIDSQFDFVVPARTKKGFESYPEEQDYAEKIGNSAFFHLTGHKLDMWFGPVAFRSRLAHYFLDYKGEYGDLWDSCHIPRLRMMKDGHKFVSIEIDYIHPSEQTISETGNVDFIIKRVKQLNNLIPAFKEEALKLGML